MQNWNAAGIRRLIEILFSAVLAVMLGTVARYYWVAYQQSPAALARKAADAYQELALDRAIIYWQQALRKAPDDPELHYNLALALESTGNINEAITEYARVIEINPILAAPRFNLALICLQQGDEQKAEQLLLEASEIAPFFTGAHLLLGKLYQQEGKSDLARERYLEVINLGVQGTGELAEAYFQVGRIYYDEGKPAQSAEAWQRTLEIQPDHQAAGQYLAKLRDQNPP